MNRLEDELKLALRRVDPPEGFAERVLARVASKETPKASPAHWWLHAFGSVQLRWAAVCAMCVSLAVSGALYQRAADRRRGEAAKEQLMLALRITGSKLQIAEQSLKELDSSGRPER